MILISGNDVVMALPLMILYQIWLG